MTEREQFEATFSAPPYEFRMERWGGRAAWAGNYKSYYVQCAWDGYQLARAALAQPVAAEPSIEDLCARIKAADDAAADRDYMLDSDDCISVLRGTWEGPLAMDKPQPPTPA